jgi:hypothetical protein
MNTKQLGRLEKVGLREVWTSESGDFTPWLALPENLKLLGEAIGIDLELEAQEKDVGPFRLDLLCKESDSGHIVVIENQIEDTDHDHLGKLLTYAAGLDAAVVIWIARSFTDEHRAALDWLNVKANGSARFFGAEIEVSRIGDSAPAPRFNIVSEPNESSDRAKQAAREGGLTELEQMRIKFWTEFTGYMKSTGATFQCKPVTPGRWLRVKSPFPQGFRCGFGVNPREQWIEAYFGSYNEGKMKELRRICREHKEELKRELGENANFSEESEESGEFWIWVDREDDPSNVNNWPRQHQWMKETMERMLKAVGKYVQHGSRGEPEADQNP